MATPTRAKIFGVLLLLVFVVFLTSYLAGRVGIVPDKEGTRLSSDKIAVVFVRGFLSESRGVIQEIDKYKGRDDVKALVLRIDSPGGAVGSAQEIYAEVTKLKEKKTVLASLGNVAASGGYYVASAAQEIVANPGTLTGSIGVVTEYPNIQELMKKIGWKTEIMKSGRFKDIGSPMREMTAEEQSLMQALLDNVHAQFVRDVAEGRQKPIEEIEPWADGRVLTGEQAREAGLIDRLGNLQDALDRAAELAGIEGKPTVLYPEEKKLRFLEYVLQGFSDWVLGQFRGTLEQMGPNISFCSGTLSTSGGR